MCEKASFSFSPRAKIISTTLALRTTKYLSKERDYIPWESALRNLNYYILMFDRNEVYGVLQVSPTLVYMLIIILAYCECLR